MDQFWWQDTQMVWSDGQMCWQDDCPEDCQPGPPPDEPSEFECFCCDDGAEGQTPAYWTVEIPAGTNNGCGDCAGVAGTYELNQGCCGLSAENAPCDYELDGTGADCGLDYLILNVVCGEENYIQVQIGTSSVAVADGGWQYSGEYSCSGGSYELTEQGFLGNGNQCDWTGTTVTATPSLS